MSLHMYGGPADEQAFTCSRAPRLLRVTFTPPTTLHVPGEGKWDCLDQLDDVPRPDEEIYLYEGIYSGPGMFVDGRTPGGRRWGMFVADATYRYIMRATGELDRVLRETASWRRFVEAYFGERLNPDGTPSNVYPITKGN